MVLEEEQAEADPPPRTCVWVGVRSSRAGPFMNPVKLQGLLGLHSHELEEAMNLTVRVEDAAARLGSYQRWGAGQDPPGDPPPPPGRDPSTATSLASTALPLQVVDTNSTSVVTPRLSRRQQCRGPAPSPTSCTPGSCLNGGRCVGLPNDTRCVCPGGSWGAHCKVLSRTFFGSGWAWVQPLPPCLPALISFRILTLHPHSLLLYLGPLTSHSRRKDTPSTPAPMVAVQLMDGRPQVLVEGEAGAVKLEVSTSLHDGDWHVIHLQLDSRGVVLMVDMCGRGWEESLSESHCVARAAWPRGGGLASWAMPGPMQLGGLAHELPPAKEFGWSEAPTTHPLDGCVSHLAVNGQLVDLGQPAYTHGSVGGCRLQDAACPGGRTACGLRGACVGGLSRPRCECEPGWTGPSCTTPTVPTALGSLSYVKLALSFAPPPRQLSVQLRVRTRGPKDGLLMQLSAQHRHVMFTLQLRAGVACASVSGAGWAARAACVEGRPVGDGAWHTVRAERHGHNLLVSVDDGDGWRRNESLVTLEEGEKAEGRNSTPPAPLHVDKHDGVTLGGLPEFVGVSLIAVREDLKDTCLDDVRVSGRPLPLPPSLNATKWGQVTTSEHLGRGCPAGDPCADTKCPAPLLCTNTWAATRRRAGGWVACKSVSNTHAYPRTHINTDTHHARMARRRTHR
ncbi:Cj-cadherin [Penaeus vannamei]|uniref:Cj-cadherin n=1 Tax=Penaeus vannamei TaxID=6689 RepID=A0A3R7MJD7_PENVA|nr:Cj-cadherin [Penaeus vannamei]